MPHPREGYRLKDGTKVPSVTTVLKYKDCGGLLYWAWNEGREGRDYRDTRDRAADAGTLGHAMIEAWAAGRDVLSVEGPPELLALAHGGFESFQRWAAQSRLRIVKSEVILVSEKWRFAGCLDSTMAISVDDELGIGDFKFSNSIYTEYLMQIAAYGLLYEETFGDKIESFHLLRFSKSHCDFSHHSWRDLSLAREAFLDLLSYHNKKIQLDKRVK